MAIVFNVFTGNFDYVSIGAVAVAAASLLLENGSHLLLETGDKLLLEG
jgi:hypothetical protein